jgi:cytochrome b
VAGVAIETRLSRVNLVGAMITGVKILPDDRREGAA